MNARTVSLLRVFGIITVLLFSIGSSVYYENKRGVYIRQLVNEVRPRLESQEIKIIIPGYYHRDRLVVKAISSEPIDRDVIVQRLGNDFTLSTEPMGGGPDYIYTKHPEFIREIRVIINKEKPVGGSYETEIDFYASPGHEASSDILPPMLAFALIVAVFFHFKYSKSK